MPSEESFSDDYVASLLAKDAKTSTTRYSTAGLPALLPSRPTTNAPKANTRFLRNIIKETDSHNAALRVKEVQDAKARLRRLHTDSLESSTLGKRCRDEDDHRLKRRRIDRTDDEYSMSRRGSENISPQNKKHDDDGEYKRSHRRRKEYYTSDEDRSRNSHRHRYKHHHHRSHRRHSRSLSEVQYMKPPRSRSSRHEDPSRSPRVDPDHRHNRRRRRRRSTSCSSRDTSYSHVHDSLPSKKNHSPKSRNVNNGDSAQRQQFASRDSQDSDPLDSIIGPPPPPPVPKIQARGRGTFASSATIDAHFSSRYDPATDVRPDPDIEEDDWDQALEALRDRQRWKQQGADRLRAAGFTEEEVGKWETTGGEKREEDVRWRGRGEDREWDRGKVVGEEGVETKPEWGRLKGT